MGKKDLDKLVKLASQIADENASVYGKQIKKSYIEKEVFRPDSFIRLAAGSGPGPGSGSGSGSGPGPSSTTTNPPGTTSGSSGSTPPGGKTSPPAGGSGGGSGGGSATKKGLFQSFFDNAIKKPFKYENDTDTGELALRFYNTVKGDASRANSNILKNYGLDGSGSFEDFWVALRPSLEKRLMTTDYDVATVGPSGRGGEKVLSVFALGGGWPETNVFVMRQMANVLQQERLRILRALYPSVASTAKESTQTLFKWWDALSGSLGRK